MYNQSLENFTDDMFYQKYMVEAYGISYDIFPLSQELFRLVINNLLVNQLIYTGYNWNFDKKEFVKLNNNKSEYALYIRLIDLDKSSGYTGRSISQEEKTYNTDIIINISSNIPVKHLRMVIRHELQHIKEMYILKNKNVLQSDKTTIYNSPEFDINFKEQTKLIFYPLSKAEQHAIILEVYDYVYYNKNITRTNLMNPELENITKINMFYYQWRYFINFIGLNIYFYDITILKIGYILKTKFNYKNNKLTKLYMQDVINYKIDIIDRSLLYDIMNYLKELIRTFQHKVMRTIYLAIEDRPYK